MSHSTAQTLRLAIARILRPLVRILLRNGIGCADFVELAKQAYVDVAMSAEFQLPGRKPTVSRAAVITGLTRKDVQRLLPACGLERAGEHDGGYTRAARVVAGWVRDAEFHDGADEPAELPMDGEAASFAALVRRHSGDMPARAVLDELLRTGVAESAPDGRLRLLKRAFVPGCDDRHKLRILGTDVAALLQTIDHNLRPDGGAPLFQRKARYDNLPAEALEALRPLLAAECQRLIESADRRLAAHDRDTNPASSGEGRRVAGIGVYYFESDYELPTTENQQ